MYCIFATCRIHNTHTHIHTCCANAPDSNSINFDNCAVRTQVASHYEHIIQGPLLCAHAHTHTQVHAHIQIHIRLHVSVPGARYTRGFGTAFQSIGCLPVGRVRIYFGTMLARPWTIFRSRQRAVRRGTHTHTLPNPSEHGSGSHWIAQVFKLIAFTKIIHRARTNKCALHSSM